MTTKWNSAGGEYPACDLLWDDVAAPGAFMGRLNQHAVVTNQVPRRFRLLSEAGRVRRPDLPRVSIPIRTFAFVAGLSLSG